MTYTLSTDELAQQYIQARIRGDTVTVKHLAAEHGRSYDALRKVAAKGKWSARAALAVAERNAAVAKEIGDRNAMTSILLIESVETEVQVRQRHAQLARSLQRAAIERLLAMKPRELSPQLAVTMLKAGIEIERVALALGDVAPKLFDASDDNSAVQEAVQTAMVILARHAQSVDSGSANPSLQSRAK